MDQLSKHVAGRLKAQPAPGPHPDAALLSAFAENALPAADRGPLLQHLGACSDCREIVFLALPGSAEAQKILVLKPSRFRHWGLTWGAAAAVGIVAVFFTTQRLEHKSQIAKMVAPASATRTETAADIGMETGAEKKIAAETPPREIDEMQAARESSSNKKAVAVDEYASKPQPQAKHMTGKMQAPLDFDRSGEVHLRVPQQSANSLGGAAGLYRRKDKDKDKNEDRAEKQKENSDSIAVATEAPAPAGKAADSAILTTAQSKSNQPALSGQRAEVQGAAVSAPSPAPPAVNVPASSEMVEVQASAPEVEPHSLSKVMKVGAAGRNVAVSLPKWSLTAAGEVQRSLDHGKTWLPAQPVPGVVFRAVASVGQEVWAAGNAGALYHSSDSGLIWSRLAVKSGAKDIQDDLTEIDFTDATHGHLKTSAGADFTTSDAGQTWQLK